MVYYRKYRPQTIAELDSPKLRETLTAVLSQKEIPHAFLFTGPKGLGKTSTARIIAKVLNCTSSKRNGIEPCNECDQCVSITNGSNIDVLEIDGASNRGIDEIRELRERVNLAPSASRKKVYIIDEVHMLTNEAFNALLKTIEEPPAHVVFIFATTEPQKVPATIISRCFHISLNRASKEELTHALKRIVKEEKIDIDDEALGLIAEMGDGGYRDTTKILEEVVALSNGKKITKEVFETSFKTTNILPHLHDFMENFLKKDAKATLQVVSQVVEEGTDVKFFLYQILSDLHKRLLREIGNTNSTGDIKISLSDMQILIPLFEEAYQGTKYAPIPSLPLELAVVVWCQQGAVIASETKQSNTDKEIAASPLAPHNDRNTMKDMLKKEQNLKVKQVLSGVKPVAPKKEESTSTQTDLPKDIKDTSVLLENLIYKVKPYNHSVAGVLRGCTVKSLTDTQLVLQTAYAFHKEKLGEAQIVEILEKVVREITGKQLRVVVELKK